jgi:hypothetical protein
MYKGTLAMVGPWQALVTFQQLIVLADINGVVDMTADAITRETTIPIEIITTGIEALEKPDPQSRSPDEEGRRIVRLRENSNWGWRIVNYQHYRRIKSEEERAEYQAQYYQRVTKPKRQGVSTDSIRSRHAEVEADVSKNPREIFQRLLKTSGAEPPRTERIQRAIDKVGGWPKIRNCTVYDLPAAERAFCEAYQCFGEVMCK